MILVDTGIWIDHLKTPDSHLAILGERLQALVHPYVLGELALGSLPNRARLLERMAGMPQPPLTRHAHVMQLIEAEKLFSTGIGYVDAHLLASTRLLPGSRIWTRDGRLRAQAERLGVAYIPA
ncbi:MAG: type II toxin-antitoxin system VapC family toxin [Sphingomonadaceae bacterium]